MKQNYIAPAVESIKVIPDQMMAGQSELSGNNQEGEGPQLSKEQEYTDEVPLPDGKDIWSDEE